VRTSFCYVAVCCSVLQRVLQCMGSLNMQASIIVGSFRECWSVSTSFCCVAVCCTVLHCVAL